MKPRSYVSQVHRFYLRPGLPPVTLELPEDITAVEAERLARFIETLVPIAKEDIHNGD